MALSGVHICFSFIADGVIYKGSASPLPYRTQSAQAMTSPGTSTISAPAAPAQALGQSAVLISICSSAPIYYVVGPTPDINAGPRRYFDPTMMQREDIFVDAGDKFAWMFA